MTSRISSLYLRISVPCFFGDRLVNSMAVEKMPLGLIKEKCSYSFARSVFSGLLCSLAKDEFWPIVDQNQKMTDLIHGYELQEIDFDIADVQRWIDFPEALRYENDDCPAELLRIANTAIRSAYEMLLKTPQLWLRHEYKRCVPTPVSNFTKKVLEG